VFIKDDGFTIQCPSVVCENQTVVYSLPFNAQKICEGQYHWSVQDNHGHIDDVNQENGNATVTWSNIDATGFGYIYFYSEQCDFECLLPTTIKVPVILNEGTIVGRHYFVSRAKIVRVHPTSMANNRFSLANCR